MKKAEKIFKEIEKWVEAGEGNLLLSSKNYEFLLIKSQVKDGLITIFKLGNDYPDAVMDELSRENVSILGHYIPKLKKFLGFKLYLPGDISINEKPKNNILVQEVQEKISERFSNIIYSEAKKELDNINEESPNVRFISREKFPKEDIPLDDVVEYLLHGEDIIEKIFDKKYKDSYIVKRLRQF